MNELINNLTKKLNANPNYKGRNRKRDHVIFFFTDSHKNIINIKITHDEIKNEMFNNLTQYL